MSVSTSTIISTLVNSAYQTFKKDDAKKAQAEVFQAPAGKAEPEVDEAVLIETKKAPQKEEKEKAELKKCASQDIKPKYMPGPFLTVSEKSKHKPRPFLSVVTSSHDASEAIEEEEPVSEPASSWYTI